MKEKILTVVVPSYNAQEFLPKGIPTFLDNRILDDIEILIVDDGSTDKTGKIADSYHEKYPNTVTVVHKENGGHGSTINTGIRFAHGKYFSVVDADDWVKTDNFVKLVSKLKRLDSDLIVSSYEFISSDNKVLKYKKIKKLPYNKEVLLFDFDYTVLKNINIHTCFFKTEILRKHNIKCHEHLFYVDAEYILYSLLHIKTITSLNLTIVQYLYGRVGQSVSTEGQKKYNKHALKVLQYLLYFYENNKAQMNDTQKIYYRKKIAFFLQGIYSVSLAFNTKNSKAKIYAFDKWLYHRSPDVYKANRNICITILRLTNFKLYGFCSFIYKKLMKFNYLWR